MSKRAAVRKSDMLESEVEHWFSSVLYLLYMLKNKTEALW